MTLMHTRRSAGLYCPEFERDNCGFGLIAHMDDKPSHWLAETAIKSLERLTHRGAMAADGMTGDGCGLLMKKPDQFLRAIAGDAGINLGAQYASGIIFLNQDPVLAAAARDELTAAISNEGLELAGWRQVPTDSRACGDEALKTLPVIEQIFVNAAEGTEADEFERRLFVARRRAEQAIDPQDEIFYVPSLSTRVFSFKGLVLPENLPVFIAIWRTHDWPFGLPVPSTLFHQHLAAVATRATFPISGAQRRDQHHSGQSAVGAGANARSCQRRSSAHD